MAFSLTKMGGLALQLLNQTFLIVLDQINVVVTDTISCGFENEVLDSKSHAKPE